jgi:hypothetical protein
MDINVSNPNIQFNQQDSFLNKDNIYFDPDKSRLPEQKEGVETQKTDQTKQTGQKQFQQQFKDVSRQETKLESEKTTTDISSNYDRFDSHHAPAKNIAQQTMKNAQMVLQKSENMNLGAPKENIGEVLQDNNSINKLKNKEKDYKANLQNKMLGEKKSSALNNLTLSSSVGLFKSWLQKVKSKPGAADSVGNIEEEDEQVQSKGDAKSQKADKIKNSSIFQQQKLFSLNIQSSIRYLKNLKTFQQKYSPEMLIYDEETGFVNPEETLECLGWDSVEQFQTKLNNELNVDKLKEIHENDKILNAALDSGFSVYKANHPLHSEKRLSLAIESLTGDITMIEKLEDLEKLELQGQIYRIYSVAD